MPPRQRALRYVVTVVVCFTVWLLYTRMPSEIPLVYKTTRHIDYIPSAFDWKTVTPSYPPLDITPLPADGGQSIPRIQHTFSTQSWADAAVNQRRRRKVKDIFLRSWRSYKKYAWMHDELLPLSGGSADPFGGWAATLVDSLDTLWIMDLKEDFYDAVEEIGRLDWSNTNETACNMFETTIRYLGGLLAAYDLSDESVLLSKAVELGDMLYAGFDTPNRMPPFWLDFEKAKSGRLEADYSQATASFGSLSLEFTRLAQLTKDNKYYDAVNRVTEMLAQHQFSTKLPGMWPTTANLRGNSFEGFNTFSIGGLADSMYEYFPKMHLLMSGRERIYELMYRDAAAVIEEYLLFRPMVPKDDDILFSGSAWVALNGLADLVPEGQHLTCFAGGMFALGGRAFDDQHHVQIGEKLMRGCIYAYDAFPTGLMPEIFHMIPCDSVSDCRWNETRAAEEGSTLLPPGFSVVKDSRYILRPEAIESVFILYRITGQQELQDAAWRMLEAIEKATSTYLGNAAITNVNVVGETTKQDSMESFWLAETLKYFYLIFAPPDLISLDEYVFNTEAHPFKREK